MMMMYEMENNMPIIEYADADWVETDIESTKRYLFVIWRNTLV